MRVRVDLDREQRRRSFMVAASGCAPPMPPRPAVSTSRPASVPPKCWRRGLGEGLVGALQDALGADVDPASRRSSGRTSSGPCGRARGSAPRWPSAARGSSWRSARAARPRGCGRRRPACPTGRAASRRSPSSRSARDDRVEALPVARGLADAAVDDEVARAARPPRGRGCSSACAARLPAASPCRRASVPRGARIVRAAWSSFDVSSVTRAHAVCARAAGRRPFATSSRERPRSRATARGPRS